MKSILLSIQPKWVAKILNGEKTIEVRKRFPKDYKGWVYIYCTKDIKEELCFVPATSEFYSYPKNFFITKQLKKMGLTFNDKVVARFYCDKVDMPFLKDITKESCLTLEELIDYLEGKPCNAIPISQLEIFDEPKELSEFYTKHYPQFVNMVKNKTHYELTPLTKAPQNYCYIEEITI